MKLKGQGWEPDLVITHVGFGNGHTYDAFPNARKIGFSSGLPQQH